MNETSTCRVAVVFTLVASASVLCWLVPGKAQSSSVGQQPAQRQATSAQPATQAPQERTAEQTHKNIQVLKGLPDSQLIPVMNMFSAALGVRCDFCHVKAGDEWQWDRDDKRAKQTTRKMIEMTASINRATFENRAEVSCYTCHLGHEHPTTLPALPVAVPPREEGQRPQQQWPAVQQLLDKYVAAAGGKDAAGRLKTLAIKGAYVNAEGASLPMEMWFEAPSRLVVSVKKQNGGEFVLGLNGEAGWISNDGKQREMDPGELARIRSLALALDPLQLKPPYPRLLFGGKARVGDREVYVLRMTTRDRKRVQLSFDTQTGLLLRRYTLTDTPVGPDPEQIDFGDFRDVAGLMLPFSLRVSYLGPQISATYRFTEVKHNVTIDGSKFSAGR